MVQSSRFECSATLTQSRDFRSLLRFHLRVVICLLQNIILDFEIFLNKVANTEIEDLQPEKIERSETFQSG